ncbi:MAG: deoxycytidylate deaminase [Minisyncoccales bacterium]
MVRLSKERYYLNIAKEVAQRSTCYRNQGGAVIVREDQIVATGYIGAPRKTKDCFERQECLRDKLKIPHGRQYEMCRSVHAEMNAIINAARAGVSLLGGDIYIYCENPKDKSQRDSFPCFICKKMIINAGLQRAICSTKDGQFKIFAIADWIKDWQEKDIIDDRDQYGADLNFKEKLV